MDQLKTTEAGIEGINNSSTEADTFKAEFLTYLSHELRTPLNSINGAIYYLQHTGKMNRNEQMEFYGIISHETGKLANTVENLLDFLRSGDWMKVARGRITAAKGTRPLSA